MPDIAEKRKTRQHDYVPHPISNSTSTEYSCTYTTIVLSLAIQMHGAVVPQMLLCTITRSTSKYEHKRVRITHSRENLWSSWFTKTATLSEILENMLASKLRRARNCVRKKHSCWAHLSGIWLHVMCSHHCNFIQWNRVFTIQRRAHCNNVRTREWRDRHS